MDTGAKIERADIQAMMEADKIWISIFTDEDQMQKGVTGAPIRR